MLGDSTMVESSSAEASAAAAGIHEGCSEIGMNSGEEDKGRGDELGERSFGGNRWPRQETLALLKIRSDMDAVFRDSSLKGPLWEEVSRKLAELGYHRSAKKCKEKFENVYKYHKRTKDGRTGKADGKTYRFFDQLEALQNQNQNQNQNLHSLQSLSPPKPQTPTPTTSAAMPWANPPSNLHLPTTVSPASIAAASLNPTTHVSTQAVPLQYSMPPYSNAAAVNVPSSYHNISSHLFSTSTSSSTASDVDDSDQGGSSRKKRKWKEFFRRLTKEVIQKQEELQNKFLQTIEKCEQERTAREDAWRIQEMARINREHEILVQERSTAAAKDAAVIAFLQKISGHQPNTVQVQLPQETSAPQPTTTPTPTPPPPPPPPPPAPAAAAAAAAPLTLPAPVQVTPAATQALMNFGASKMTNGGGSNAGLSLSSPSRWPKAEVEALIRLRTSLDVKYQENSPKAPLWEEISAGMKRLGYNRNAKRCKEKWENINKYFKKVKESNKKRPEDSKTCPYFHQLDAIYRERNSKNDNNNNNSSISSSMAPLMVRPEQQWPPQPQAMAAERENAEQMEEDEEDIGESEEEEYEGNDFELVANKTASMASGE